MQLTIKKFNDNTLQIEDCGMSEKWNNDNEQYSSLNDWIKVKHLSEQQKRVALKNSVNVGHLQKKYDDISICNFVSNANNCQFNTTLVHLMTNPFNYNGGQFNVYPQNIDKVVVSYSVRSLIQSTWLNNNDEYRVPNSESK